VNAPEIIRCVGGLYFKAVGPFLIADLNDQPESVFGALVVSEHGMEPVWPGERTEPHEHDFLSFYKSVALDLVYEGKLIMLPGRALTIILPGIRHSWFSAWGVLGSVGSLDSRHQKQVLTAV
jgi:hypothetical protein